MASEVKRPPYPQVEGRPGADSLWGLLTGQVEAAYGATSSLSLEAERLAACWLGLGAM